MLALRCCLCVAAKDADTVNISCIDKALNGLPLKRRYSRQRRKIRSTHQPTVSGRTTMISAAAPGIKVPPVTSRMVAGARLNASNARSRKSGPGGRGSWSGPVAYPNRMHPAGQAEWLSFCITINWYMVRGNCIDSAIGNRLDYCLPVIF